MFIQVITGQVADRAGLEAALDRWHREVRPGAMGFLGSTGGVTDDGRFIGMVRFDSAQSARANSDRPEQSAWWSDTERCFSGPVTFHDCTQIDMYHGGGTDDAGFVQVMQGHGDHDRLRHLDEEAEAILPDARPDLLGSVRAWDGDEYTEAAYFTSEADARAAEGQELPSDVAGVFQEWQEAMGDITYYDLTAPKIMT